MGFQDSETRGRGYMLHWTQVCVSALLAHERSVEKQPRYLSAWHQVLCWLPWTWRTEHIKTFWDIFTVILSKFSHHIPKGFCFVLFFLILYFLSMSCVVGSIHSVVSGCNSISSSWCSDFLIQAALLWRAGSATQLWRTFLETHKEACPFHSLRNWVCPPSLLVNNTSISTSWSAFCFLQARSLGNTTIIQSQEINYWAKQCGHSFLLSVLSPHVAAFIQWFLDVNYDQVKKQDPAKNKITKWVFATLKLIP